MGIFLDFFPCALYTQKKYFCKRLGEKILKQKQIAIGHVSACGNDVDLVSLSRCGNAAATEILVCRYRPLLEAAARKYYIAGNELDDLYQECVIAFCKAIRTYDERRGAFPAFVEMCVRRHLITVLRSSTRSNSSSSLTPLTEWNLHNLPQRTRRNLIESKSMEQMTNAVIYRRLYRDSQVFSALERSILDCFLQGMTYKEVSVELTHSVKAIDNAMQRIRKKVLRMGFPEL